MTHALVVYESLFGDAWWIAAAVADGLSARVPARAVAAADAPTTIGPDIGLLVVGGPSLAMGMPRPESREQMAREHPGLHLGSFRRGLREWLQGLTVEATDLAGAAFDIRTPHPRLLAWFDHAARDEERFLEQLLCRIAAPAEHFYVMTAEGPLRGGEVERARQWGTVLAERFAGTPTPG